MVRRASWPVSRIAPRGAPHHGPGKSRSNGSIRSDRALAGRWESFWFLCCGRNSNLSKGYRGYSMPGEDRGSGSLFPYMNCETRTGELSTASDPRDRGRHPGSRASGDQGACSKTGWTSIAPGKPLQALLLRAFISNCPEPQLMEQLYCNLLFRRLVGLSMDATVYLKTRDRQIEGWLAARFLAGGGPARQQGRICVVRRAMRGHRHADRCLGVDEEISPQGRC